VDELPNEELKTLFRETVKDWESRKWKVKSEK
jgi:hypothetical protein